MEAETAVGKTYFTGQPSFAHHGVNSSKMALLGGQKQHQVGLVGAAWRPMVLYAHPLSPNDHPTAAQGSLLGVIKGHPELAIFHQTHAGHKIAKSSPAGPHWEANLGNLEIAPRTPIIGWGVQIKRLP